MSITRNLSSDTDFSSSPLSCSVIQTWYCLRLISTYLHLTTHNDHRILNPQFRRLLIGSWKHRHADRAIHILELNNAHGIAFLGSDAACVGNGAAHHNLLPVYLFCNFSSEVCNSLL